MSSLLKLSLLNPIVARSPSVLPSSSHFCDRNPGFSCSYLDKEIIQVGFNKSSLVWGLDDWEEEDKHAFSLLTDTYPTLPLLGKINKLIPESILQCNPIDSISRFKDSYPILSEECELIANFIPTGSILSWIPQNTPFSLTYSEKTRCIDGLEQCFEASLEGLDTEILNLINSAFQNIKKNLLFVNSIEPTTMIYSTAKLVELGKKAILDKNIDFFKSILKSKGLEAKDLKIFLENAYKLNTSKKAFLRLILVDGRLEASAISWFISQIENLQAVSTAEKSWLLSLILKDERLQTSDLLSIREYAIKHNQEHLLKLISKDDCSENTVIVAK